MVARAAFLLAALLALGAAAEGAAGQAGGLVGNVPPTVEGFANLRGGTAPPGSAETLSGLVRDGNGAADVAALRVEELSGRVAPSERAVAAADLAASSPPPDATAGWRVWAPSPDRIAWTFETAYRGPGAYAWRLLVRDEGGWAASPSLAVRVPGGGAPCCPEAPGLPPGPAPGGPGPGDGGEPGAGLVLDLTSSLSAARLPGGSVLLGWAPAPGVQGYQLWRSTSPYELLADLPAAADGFKDAPPGPASYKLTAYVDRTPAGGWLPERADPTLRPGWDAATARAAGPPASPSTPGPPPPAPDPAAGLDAPAQPGWALAAGLAAAAGAAALAVRRPWR